MQSENSVESATELLISVESLAALAGYDVGQIDGEHHAVTQSDNNGEEQSESVIYVLHEYVESEDVPGEAILVGSTNSSVVTSPADEGQMYCLTLLQEDEQHQHQLQQQAGGTEMTTMDSTLPELVIEEELEPASRPASPEQEQQQQQQPPAKRRRPEARPLHENAVCQTIYERLRNVMGHTSDDTGDLRFKCSGCPASFSHRYNLNAHRCSRAGETSNKCFVCGVTYEDGEQLRAHAKTHLGDKPYKCSQCDRAFQHLYSLTAHARLHSGDLPYKCRECGRSFAQFQAYHAHNRSHREVALLYKCEVCGRTFKREGDRSRHVQMLHAGKEGENFRCGTCSVAFTSRQNLARHAQLHVDVGPPPRPRGRPPKMDC